MQRVIKDNEWQEEKGQWIFLEANKTFRGSYSKHKKKKT